MQQENNDLLIQEIKNETEHWNNEAKKTLLGKRIVDVRYLTDAEMEVLGWTKRPVYFKLDDGTFCFISMDDEGNNGGSLFVNTEDCLPTLSYISKIDKI